MVLGRDRERRIYIRTSEPIIIGSWPKVTKRPLVLLHGVGEANASDRPDREHDAFMTMRQQSKHIEDLLPRPIFEIDKPHTLNELFAADNLGVGIDSLA